MATRIYTKTGDKGETGLFGGQRVQKDHRRVEAYGTVDELNAQLGLVRALQPPQDLGATLATIQALLFDLGAELATPPSARPPATATLCDDDVRWLEARIDEAEVALPPLKSFILPSGSQLAAALHIARAVCRRAERRLVSLRQSEPDTRLLTVVFLNRLADLLFVLARRANHLAGLDDEPWQKRQPHGS